MSEVVGVEDVESFRLRARAWLAETFPRLEDGLDPFDEMEERAAIDHARGLQRLLFDGGFAGIVFPREYGGLGLTAEHQRVFSEESLGYQSPLRFSMSTIAIIAPTLLEFGTEEQKRRHIPAILQGEMWVQMLSEPSGGSDLAGAVTRADADGDGFVLNGAKVWTSGGHLRDYGLCLARTNWDVPKHSGLSMFIVKLDDPGVTVRPLRQVNGSTDFCEEFFDDVVLGPERLVGGLNEGWSVASKMLVHERNAIGGGTAFAGRITGRRRGMGGSRRQGDLVRLVRDRGLESDPAARGKVAEAQVLSTVRKHLIRRVSVGMRRGELPPAATTVLKLFTTLTAVRIATIGFELAGSDAVVWDAAVPDGDRWGQAYLMRQSHTIGGGTSEMQRNAISERLLGMPRERVLDRDTAFNQVQRGPRTNQMV